MAKRQAPEPSPQENNPAYNPFLKFPDVLVDGEGFTITEGFTRRRPGRYGEQIIMEVTRDRDGKTFDFAIGVGSMNHRTLARMLGDERSWRGTLTLQRKAPNRGQTNPFIDVIGKGADDVPF